MTEVARDGMMMPLPTRRTAAEEADEMHPVRSRSPLPDLLPRSVEDLAMMRTYQEEAEQGRRYVAPRRDLPPPYKNDEECDEFEDQTIDTMMANVPAKVCVEMRGASTTFAYKLGGPSVVGEARPVFSCGHLFQIACPDGAVCFYNDSDKYEMHVRLTFLALSPVELNERAEIYVMSNTEFCASRVVYPGETTELIRAKAGKFRLSAKAVPLNDDVRVALYGEVNDHVADELSDIAAALCVRDQQLDEEMVLTYCESHRHLYVDADFRPCDYSLYRPDLDLYLPRFLPWHRPSTWIHESQQKEVRIFRRDVYPSQVSQGSIGDAYLVSALALLAERKMLLQDLFRHPISAASGKTERALGAYWITLNFNGWWLPILLDDYFPSTRDGPEYAVCRTDLRRLWVPLLEKAYAKVHGSYANIAIGDALEPLTEFTGFPISRFDRMWSEARADGSTALFDEMQSYHKHKYLQLLCTPSNGADALSNAQPATSAPTSEMEANYQAKGLKLHHGYSVIDVQSFGELDLRLLRLRNPWGTGAEWDGAWGKSDRRWATFAAVKDACYAAGGEPSDLDGTFWMDWQTALQMFCGGGCCHVREPWYDYRIRGEFDRVLPSVVLEIHVSHPTMAFLTLAQEDERDGPNLEYDAILLTVYRQDGRKARLEATSTSLVEKPDKRLAFNFSREVALRTTFRPEHSPYYVIPRIHNTSVTKPYILGLLPDTYVGNGIVVEFKKISRECRALQNHPSFIPSATMSDTAAEYQVRSVRQPMDCVGSEIKDDRLMEFGVVE